jgi:flagellar biosynthesis anti-sigma factor FlgM
MEIKLQNTVSGLSASGTPKKSNIANGAKDLDASSGSIAGLSPETSLRLSEIQQRLLDESPVDGTRVARIAGAVQSGSYKVNPQQAAEKLIAMERMLSKFS